MPLTIICPGCKAELRVREEYAGKQVACPRCSGTVTVPSAEDPPMVQPVVLQEYVEEVRPMPRGTRAGEPTTAVGEGPPPAPDRHGPEPGYDARRPRRQRRSFMPCPRCKAEGATRVTWTPWGSFYGPSLLTHVRCPQCGYAYNGHSGKSNLVGILLFSLIPFLLLVAINVGLWFAVGRIMPMLLYVIFGLEGIVVLVMVILGLTTGGGHGKQ